MKWKAYFTQMYHLLNYQFLPQNIKINRRWNANISYEVWIIPVSTWITILNNGTRDNDRIFAVGNVQVLNYKKPTRITKSWFSVGTEKVLSLWNSLAIWR